MKKAALFVLFLALYVMPCMLRPACAQEIVTNGKVTVQSVQGKKGVSGFDVYTDGKILCSVRLSSQEGIIAKTVKKDGNALVFTDLSGQGVTLGKGSFVKVEAVKDNPFPQVSFRIEMGKFDKDVWVSSFGPAPFHFLTLQLANAEVVHHRGWIVATPLLDPYSLQVGKQGIVCSKWSRDWMWAPPFGACPLPVAGLWTPKEKKYAAFDFTHSRLTDHTDKYIASSYCWQSGADKNFVTLVYPFAKGYVNAVRYPANGDVIASHCEIIYNLDLSYWKDPNTFYQDYIWSRYKDLLPSAPVMNDLSYFPGDAQPRALPSFGGVGLTYKVPANDGWESNFMEEGTIVPVGDVWTFPTVDAIYTIGNKKTIENVKSQLDYMESKAKKFKVEGEDCVYWEKPLEGKPKLNFAGDVTTLRNIHGWSTAQTFLDVYRNEKAAMPGDQKARYLAIIDGALNWTKYNVCTRNDISDVPEAMFTIGGPGVAFCLDYYYTFRDEPARAEKAKLALEMARNLMYRYLTIFIADTDEEDNIDGTFLIEPNAGQPWTGAACANECCILPKAMISVYIATGDPIMKQYILGMLERWSLMYQDVSAPSIKKYKGKFTECYGLFDDCAIGGRGKRALYGGFDGSLSAIVFPLGDAKARIICGEKAAIVFNKEGIHTDISDYRTAKNGDNFSFRVNSSLKEPFEITLAYEWPYPNLIGRDVFIKRKGELRKLAKEGDNVEVKTAKRAYWCMQILGVRDGDVVAVGKLDESLPALKCDPIKPWSLKPKNYEAEGFKIIDLAKACNDAPSFDWNDGTSYAPYFAGEHYAYKVPYYLVPPTLNKGKACVSKGDIDIDLSAPYLFFFISEDKDGSKLTVNYADGDKDAVSFSGKYLAWQGWPNLFKCRIDIIPFQCKAKPIKSVSVQNMYVWAVTAATVNGASKGAWMVQKIAADIQAIKDEEARAQKRLESLQKGFALCLKSDYAEAKSYEFTYLYATNEEQEIPANSFLEYDIMISKDSAGINGACELTGGTVGNIRDKIGGSHPGQKIDESKKGQWVHRKVDLTDAAGQTFENVTVAVDGSDHTAGTYIAFYKNIRITDGKDKVLMKLYDNGDKVPGGEAGVAKNGGVKAMTNFSIEAVPNAGIK